MTFLYSIFFSLLLRLPFLEPRYACLVLASASQGQGLVMAHHNQVTPRGGRSKRICMNRGCKYHSQIAYMKKLIGGLGGKWIKNTVGDISDTHRVNRARMSKINIPYAASVYNIGDNTTTISTTLLLSSYDLMVIFKRH